MTSPMLANEADGWTKLHGDPPPTLHHYTTGQGLLGMLQAGRLWATNAHFMNDPKEITYAADIVQRAVREAADRHKAAVDALDPGWMDKLITATDRCSSPAWWRGRSGHFSRRRGTTTSSRTLHSRRFRIERDSSHRSLRLAGKHPFEGR